MLKFVSAMLVLVAGVASANTETRGNGEAKESKVVVQGSSVSSVGNKETKEVVVKKGAKPGVLKLRKSKREPVGSLKQRH